MIQRRVTVLCLMSYSPRVAHAHYARIPKSFTYVSHSFGEINLMVLKHTPLGEINLPSVASSANAPRCRRNACARLVREPTLLFASAMSYAAGAADATLRCSARPP